MYHNVTVVLGSVESVDVVARKVLIAGGRSAPYDYLILATGARHAYFGHDNWELFAPGLKRIEDATEIRRRILLAFEEAENETDPDERRRLMDIVIVGGGPTGSSWRVPSQSWLVVPWQRISVTSIHGLRGLF